MGERLAGRRVVITRPSGQNEAFRMLLEERGAKVVEVPLIAIAEPEDEGRERDTVLQRLEDFDWVVVTSPNGAERVAPYAAALLAAGDSATFPLFAAVGAATANSLGVSTSLVAEPATAESLVASFPAGTGRVLVVQGNLAADSLAGGIESKGWEVTRVVAYLTVHLRPGREVMLPALSAEVLFLASSSAAAAWHDAFGTTTPPVVVSMGPSTTRAAERLGLSVTATASEQTLGAMIEAAANNIGA